MKVIIQRFNSADYAFKTVETIDGGWIEHGDNSARFLGLQSACLCVSGGQDYSIKRRMGCVATMVLKNQIYFEGFAGVLKDGEQSNETFVKERWIQMEANDE